MDETRAIPCINHLKIEIMLIVFALMTIVLLYDLIYDLEGILWYYGKSKLWDVFLIIYFIVGILVFFIYIY